MLKSSDRMVIIGMALALATAGCSGTMSNGGSSGSSAGSAPSGSASASPNEIAESGLAIDRVAFDLLPEFGLGGVSYVPRPVILFRGGVACDCLDEDLSTLDIDQLRKERPNALGEWRDRSGTLEIKWSEAWR